MKEWFDEYQELCQKLKNHLDKMPHRDLQPGTPPLGPTPYQPPMGCAVCGANTSGYIGYLCTNPLCPTKIYTTTDVSYYGVINEKGD